MITTHRKSIRTSQKWNGGTDGGTDSVEPHKISIPCGVLHYIHMMMLSIPTYHSSGSSMTGRPKRFLAMLQ